LYFNKIKGHEDLLSLFRNNIEHSRFEGVYLFSGPKAVGKFTVARQLARYLLCTGVIDDSCRCETCRLFPHVPDYLEINDEQSSIRVADTEEIDNFLSLVPFRSSRRVILIDDADRLNITAANNLLKILEDSRKDAIIIMVSSQPERIIPTIKSRCYEVEFQSLSSDDTIEILKGMGHNSSRFSNIKKSLPYLKEGVLQNFSRYVESQKMVLNFLKKFPKAGEDELLGEVAELEAQGDGVFFLETFILYMNDMLKIRNDSPDVVFNVKDLDKLEEITEFWSDELCITAADRAGKALKDYRCGLNLRLKPRLASVISWTYIFMQKELKKNKK